MLSKEIEDLRFHIYIRINNGSRALSQNGKIGHYTIDDICDQILFEMIKNEYTQNAPKMSLRQYLAEKHQVEYCVDIDDIIKNEKRKDTRMIQYAQHYRDLLQERIKKEYGETLDELYPQTFEKNINNFDGYKFTKLAYREIEQLENYPILNKITEGQIHNTVRNPAFIQLHQEYYDLVSSLKVDASTPEKILECAISLFYLEWRYKINSLYQICNIASDYGYPLDKLQRIKSIISDISSVPSDSFIPVDLIPVENRLIMHQEKYYQDLFSSPESEWTYLYVEYIQILRIVKLLTSPFKKNDRLMEKLSTISTDDKAEFIKERFWIWDTIKPFEWDNNKIRYYKDIRKIIFLDQPKPHIK